MKAKTTKGGVQFDARAKAWLALLPVLAATGQLLEALAVFDEAPDAAPLKGDGDVSNELFQLEEFVRDIAGRVSSCAANVVAG